MRKKTILCFGDSNTWGFVPGSDAERYPFDVRWPGVMQKELGDAEYTVIEEAQNGRMTVWDDPFEPHLSKCGLDHLPVVLESQMPLDLVMPISVSAWQKKWERFLPGDRRPNKSFATQQISHEIETPS